MRVTCRCGGTWSGTRVEHCTVAAGVIWMALSNAGRALWRWNDGRAKTDRRATETHLWQATDRLASRLYVLGDRATSSQRASNGIGASQ